MATSVNKETKAIAKANPKQNKQGYDAVINTQRRKMKAVDLRDEDKVLEPFNRSRLINNARDLRRNASIVAWAIRKHLDYVSTFSFQSKTGDDVLDGEIEKLMTWWALPENCDVSQRHSLDQLVRMAEGAATTDGDIFINKISDGHLQLIEADRIRNPNNLGTFKGLYKEEDFYHGVNATASGKPIAYAVCDREQGNYILSYVLPAKYCVHHAHLDRYDQVRGISELSSAINTFADVYEASEYALARMKLQQIFALKMTRATPDLPDESEADVLPYKFNFGTGPNVLELDPGDDASFMESEQPSTQFKEFMLTGIQVGLKALDIPYSFFAENYTNYSGARQALLQYEQSASLKRRNVVKMLDNLTTWRLGLFVLDGELTLPDGMVVDDLNWDYIPAALPWISPLDEANANIALIEAGLMSRQEVCKSQGKDFYDVIRQIGTENELMKSLGVPLYPEIVPKTPVPVAPMPVN